MWIEEMFGDMKKHGFNLEQTMLRHFQRLSRLTLAVAILLFGWSPSVLAPFVPVYDIWLIVRSGEICAHSKLAYVLSKDV